MIFSRLFRFAFQTAVLCGLCAGVVSAQAGRPVAPTVRTQLSFLLVAGAKAAPEVFIPGPNKTTVPVRLGATAKSLPILYQGPTPLMLFAPDPKTPGARVPLASVALPPTAERVLVLLAPSGKTVPGEEIYLGVAVEDDVASMPPGSLRFLNYSGKAVAVQVGKEILNLSKGPSKVFPVAKGAAAPVEVMVQIASQETEGFETTFSSKVKILPTERQTLILLPSTKAHGRGVSVLPSRDVITPPPAPPPAPRG